MPTQLSPATIDKIEQNSGALATLSVARMDEQLSWFRRLPADERSWVTLLTQAGIGSFVQWLRDDSTAPTASGVFGIAPRELARRVSLQQTVELVRQTIAVVEQHVPELAPADEQRAANDAVLRFSREIAFAAARVYAGRAESRGAWDARLEALVVDGMVRGEALGAADSPSSQLAALGWRSTGAVVALAGTATLGRTDAESIDAVHRAARGAGLDALAGVHGGRLVVLLGGVDDPTDAAKVVLDQFADSAVVVGGLIDSVDGAAASTSAALSGLRAVAAWPGAPRPVQAADLLPERAIAGDGSARAQLTETVYKPLVAAGESLLETAVAYLGSGRALEATARALFVHTNTVRYRLKRITDLCGQALTDPRGAFTVQVALVLGRLDA